MTTSPSPPRVLVVDDEEDIRYLVKVNLELDGHQVLTARDGAEALEMARQHRPDLMLLDLMMPNVDGWQVLETIKAETDVDIQHIPVLMLTAHDTTENRMRGGIEGAIRYMSKPFSPDALRREVQDALDGDPEPVKRRAAQMATLEELARAEKGQAAAAEGRGVQLSGLEHPRRDDEPALIRDARDRLGDLTEKQRDLLDVLAKVPSVTDAANEMGVSRSNVYASLRRVGRKLGTSSVPELLALIRTGGLLD